MLTFWISVSALERDGNGHLGAFRTHHRSNLELAAEQGGPLLHPQYPHRAGVGDFGPRNAAAVVADLEQDFAIGLAKLNAYVGGPGVPDDVGERFLKDAEKSGAQFRVEHQVPQVAMDFTFDAGAILKFVGLPFQCGG